MKYHPERLLKSVHPTEHGDHVCVCAQTNGAFIANHAFIKFSVVKCIHNILRISRICMFERTPWAPANAASINLKGVYLNLINIFTYTTQARSHMHTHTHRPLSSSHRRRAMRKVQTAAGFRVLTEFISIRHEVFYMHAWETDRTDGSFHRISSFYSIFFLVFQWFSYLFILVTKSHSLMKFRTSW